jgi:quercetin dioxygenase-like cupin family protein
MSSHSTACLWSAEGLGSETPEPSYGPGVPAPDGAELPAFRYPLGGIKAETFAGGTAKEANVTGFPVSDKLAGVYMTLEPGALRELHWHANAAEWAYVIEGRCRVTTIDPENRAEIADFGVGDVWYFPRGHGHSIQGLGPGTCTFILVFDNGYFSEFGTFSITDWLGHTPPRLSPRISTFPLRPSPTSRRKKSISPRVPCRRRFRLSPRPARSTPLRSPIVTSFSPRRPISTPAAPCALSPCASFPSRRR